MTEKRKFLRVPVSIRVEAEGEPVLGSGYAMNISEIGMAIDAQALMNDSSLPKKSAQLRLKFKLPGSDRVLTVHSVVSRVDVLEGAPRIAVEFEGLSHEDRKEISQMIQLQLGQK